MRRKPYTAIGIRRVPCVRCGKPAAYQWQICALGRRFVVVCAGCDIDLNRTVLRWAKWPNWRAVFRRYAAKVRDECNA